jgi:pyruvate carboxylase subunit B
MLKAPTPRTIRVMFTPFRDGLQSVFGGKVRLEDILPAMEAAAKAGIRHFEFGGGALFQAPYFYVGTSPFDSMRAMRAAVGADADLQILTRSVSGVTLTSQAPEALALQARLMAGAGTTVDRNFDFMNDVRNLAATGQPIVDAGMHHQAVIAVMGLPFASDRVHTAAYYVDVGRRILESGVRVDSLCIKDASGTADPTTIYETARGLRAIMPPEIPLWLHTHDTAGTALTCYLAGIHGGVDGIDLSIRPLAGGTSQPDIRAMAHILKGTGYALDVDVSGLRDVEGLLEVGLADYQFNPTTTTVDARVLGFPMPGGAIGPNVHMMEKAGILDRYGEVLAEFPVVVEAGGAWTSVTPGSQQYWLQAFNNVLYGRWERMDVGYGMSVLGYFGRTPLEPDPAVVARASEQLGKPPFTGDPLEAAPRTMDTVRALLKEEGIPDTDENLFLVLAAWLPGRRPELNEGIRLLKGNPKIDLPLKRAEAPAPATAEGPAPAPAPATAPAPAPAPATAEAPMVTSCVVDEGGVRRTFTVTLSPLAAASAAASAAPALAAPSPAPSPAPSRAIPIYSTFSGSVEVVDILVGVGDPVEEGTPVVAVEAMKARHEVRSPERGRVEAIHVRLGSEVNQTQALLTLR